MRITDEQIARLRELDQAAPPAPWGDFDASGQFQLFYGDYGWYVAGAGVETDDSEQGKAAAELIARARNMLPAMLDALVAERDRADKAEARIARALDLIGEWRSSEVPVDAPHTAMQEVKVRLRILYALLDGEEGWHYAEPGICNVCGGRGCDDPEGCPKPGEVSGE